MPKRLIKTDGLPSLSTRVVKADLPCPLAIAPVGVQRIFNPEGEEASAAAAARERVPYIMSTASSTSIEDVAKANGNGVRWYQVTESATAMASCCIVAWLKLAPPALLALE